MGDKLNLQFKKLVVINNLCNKMDEKLDDIEHRGDNIKQIIKDTEDNLDRVSKKIDEYMMKQKMDIYISLMKEIMLILGLEKMDIYKKLRRYHTNYYIEIKEIEERDDEDKKYYKKILDENVEKLMRIEDEYRYKIEEKFPNILENLLKSDNSFDRRL